MSDSEEPTTEEQHEGDGQQEPDSPSSGRTRSNTGLLRETIGEQQSQLSMAVQHGQQLLEENASLKAQVEKAERERDTAQSEQQAAQLRLGVMEREKDQLAHRVNQMTNDKRQQEQMQFEEDDLHKQQLARVEKERESLYNQVQELQQALHESQAHESELENQQTEMQQQLDEMHEQLDLMRQAREQEKEEAPTPEELLAPSPRHSDCATNTNDEELGWTFSPAVSPSHSFHDGNNLAVETDKQADNNSEGGEEPASPVQQLQLEVEEKDKINQELESVVLSKNAELANLRRQLDEQEQQINLAGSFQDSAAFELGFAGDGLSSEQAGLMEQQRSVIVLAEAEGRAAICEEEKEDWRFAEMMWEQRAELEAAIQREDYSTWFDILDLVGYLAANGIKTIRDQTFVFAELHVRNFYDMWTYVAAADRQLENVLGKRLLKKIYNSLRNHPSVKAQKHSQGKAITSTAHSQQKALITEIQRLHEQCQKQQQQISELERKLSTEKMDESIQQLSNTLSSSKTTTVEGNANSSPTTTTSQEQPLNNTSNLSQASLPPDFNVDEIVGQPEMDKLVST